MGPFESLPAGIEINWFASKAEFDKWNKESDFSSRRYTESRMLNMLKTSERPFIFVNADCIKCHGNSHFLLDGFYGLGQIHDLDFQPNWRERLICSKCNLSNRARYIYSLIEHSSKNVRVWITEQDTSLYRSLKQIIPKLIGSEYLSSNMKSGTVNQRGIRHEDINQSSFKSETLDQVICLDVLEHVPDSKSAIQDIYRVLDKNGTVVATFPFERQSVETNERAIKNSDGTITYFSPPEYHGNPIMSEEILCYRHFGWDVIEEFRSAGFKTVKLGFGWSEKFANLGPEQIALVATK